MSKISKTIQRVKSDSNVDNFTVNIEKAFNDLVLDIVEEIRNYESDSVCRFKQEMLAEHVQNKFLRD